MVPVDRLRELVAVLDDAVIATDTEANITDVNDAACAMFGSTAEQLRGIALERLDQEPGRQKLTDLVTQLQDGQEVRQQQLAVQTCSCRRLDLLVTATIMFTPAGQREYIFVLRNITELERVREELLRSTHLSLLGQLAGGIGHELRNPLGTLRNSAYYLQLALEDAPPDVTETIEILDREVTHCERIINGLLACTRSRPQFVKPVGLPDLVHQALAAIPIPGNVTVHEVYPDRPAALEADPALLHQVVDNLVRNSLAAMREGGQLTVEVRCCPSHLHLLVRDTGTGISADDQERIFEPLYTTKARGTGLGLALVQIIVQQHEGRIQVNSKPGEGTEFDLTFPLTLSPPDEAANGE